MYSSIQLLKMVEEAIAALPREHEPQKLYAPIRYVLSLGGKRIRPVLMLMAYNLYRDDVKPCLMSALGLEVFHNFTLLHDDLMDKAEVRRGKTCVHLKWDDNTAILSGDNMLVLAFKYMMMCDDQKMPAVMRIFTKTAIEIDEKAVIDATANFSNSPWNDRITLHHIALQDYMPQQTFDAIVCNPPYFDKSLECPGIQRQRARHTSSLPFDTLISHSYDMLDDGGHLSVILPPEVLDNFCNICYQAGFYLIENNIILSLPDNPPKRHILVFRKTDSNTPTTTNTYCMRNPDHSYSQWFKLQLQDFLIGQIYQPE